MLCHRGIVIFVLSHRTHSEGVEVDEVMDRDLQSIMNEESAQIQKSFSNEPFKRLFWEQQLQALHAKDRRQLRWHPMLIKWCLNLKLLSSSSYRALRSSGVLVLPSERTLRDYTHWVEAATGFSEDVDRQLIEEAKIKSIPDFQKYICLVFDEVRIKEDLVYDKHSSQIIGFVNLGNINNQLLELERSQTGESQPPVATHMLVFMVRGLFSNLEFPYVQVPTSSLAGDVLFPIVWECIKHLEACDFKVIALTSDGASPNRKFFKMHKSSAPEKQQSGTSEKQQSVVYKTENIYSRDKRPLFFISDVPHLIKTVRNCWSNSFGHSKSRSLWVCC